MYHSQPYHETKAKLPYLFQNIIVVKRRECGNSPVGVAANLALLWLLSDRSPAVYTAPLNPLHPWPS